MLRISSRVLMGASFLSLLVFFITCFMWVRSYFVRELLYFWHGHVCVHSSLGELCFEYYDHPGPDNPWFSRYILDASDLDWPLSFSAGIHDPTDAASPPHIRMPYWTAAIALVLPSGALLAGRIRARRRISRALCFVCGYDLRASLDRCPECGTAIPGNQITGHY